jgi:hypothetical protein
MDVVIVTSVVVAVASAVAGALVSIWQWRRLSRSGVPAFSDELAADSGAVASQPRSPTDRPAT